MVEPNGLGRARLSSQGLTRPAASVTEAVHRLGAVQAQDYGQALWAIGSRVDDVTVADVEAAVESGEVLRTWPMRGTIHFVTASDARWLTELLAPRILGQAVPRFAELGLSDADLELGHKVATDALAGGRRLERNELLGRFTAAGVDAETGRGYRMLWYLAHIGTICIGPMSGRQQTFVLLDEWAPGAKGLSHRHSDRSGDGGRSAGLAELARRYFTGHGPATVHDLARWAGITLTDARVGLAEALPQLTRGRLGDRDHFWAAGPTGIDSIDSIDSTGAAEHRGLHLLAGFDEFVLGYKDRDAVVEPENQAKLAPGRNGVFKPVVVKDGRIVGTWARRVKARTVEVGYELFPGYEVDADELGQALDRYGRFMGRSITLRR